MYIGAAISAIAPVINLVTIARNAIGGTTSSLPPSILGGIVLGAILAFIAVISTRAELSTRAMIFAFGVICAASLVSTAAWIWMAVMNRRGRDWARITSIALFAIFVVNLGFLIASGWARHSLSHFSSILLLLDGLSAALIGLAAIILLLNSQASAYFRACSSDTGHS